jgi:DNA replication protein DnaC
VIRLALISRPSCGACVSASCSTRCPSASLSLASRRWRTRISCFLRGLRLAQGIADRKSTMPMLANLLLSDECQRRDSAASTTRAQRALLEPEMQLERWDPTAKVKYDHELLSELVSMRFVEAHRHVTIVGPVGVGKTFIAHALGHIACRHKYSVLAVRADKLLKALKHARLDHSHEAELRTLLAVDVLIVDDFGSMRWTRPRVETCTRFSPNVIAPAR